MSQLDFVALGDMVTDDFIEIQRDVRIDTDPDPEDKGYDEICFRFGDKTPYEKSVVVPAVGNSPNAALSATRLGLKTALITDTGDDDRGQEQITRLKENAIDCRWVDQHAGMPSNYHYVLRYGPERTILIKHHQYPYEVPSDLAETAPKWLYFSSIGEHGMDYHHAIAAFLKDNPETKLAFQPGSFQIDVGYDALKDVYAETDILFCNKEEAQRILSTKEDTIPMLLGMIRERGPQIAVITDGPQGAYAYNGSEIWMIPMYPDPAPPVDRTGAGDAFSSTFTSAIALGMNIPDALRWGPINSMSVVQYIGAQEGLLTREKLEEYLAKAPADYVPKKLI